MKKTKGITLIALIITVIILLILVGVSVNLLIKGDLFGSAQKAVNGTNSKIAEQQNIMDDLMDEWDELERDFCSHIWKDGGIITEATCTEAGKKQRTCTKCGKVETVEIPPLGHNYEDNKCTVCGEKLIIGANINYHEYISESGGTVSASYTSTKATRGSTDSSDSDATYSVVNNSGIQWIVLGEENGQIKITTKNIVQPTSGGYTSNNFKYLRLQDQTGYANSINELNKISEVYGKGKYADTTKFSTSGGRSFKREDLGYGPLTRTASYKYARHSDGKIYRYAANATVDGTSTTEGGTTFNYMVLDVSNSIEESSSNHTWKSLSSTANSYVTLYDYTYSGTYNLPAAVDEADTTYWLASRYIQYATGSGVAFCTLDNMDGRDNGLYLSKGEQNGINRGVRPVVYLKSNAKLTYDSTSGYTISE